MRRQHCFMSVLRQCQEHWLRRDSISCVRALGGARHRPSSLDTEPVDHKAVRERPVHDPKHILVLKHPRVRAHGFGGLGWPVLIAPDAEGKSRVERLQLDRHGKANGTHASFQDRFVGSGTVHHCSAVVILDAMGGVFG